MVLLVRINTSNPKLAQCTTPKVPSPHGSPQINSVVFSVDASRLYGLTSVSCQWAATLALVRAQSMSVCKDAAGCHNRTHLPGWSELHHQPPPGATHPLTSERLHTLMPSLQKGCVISTPMLAWTSSVQASFLTYH